MGYMYKKGKCWRVTVGAGKDRRDINLGQDLNRAKFLRISIENAQRDDLFKKSLVDSLTRMGIIANGSLALFLTENVGWDKATKRLLLYLRNIKRAKATVKYYESVLKNLEKTLNVPAPAEVTAELADKWMEQMLNKTSARGRKLSAGAVSKNLSIAKAAFQRFARWGYIDKNPFTNCEMPKVELSLPRPLTQDEITRLLKACSRPLKRAIKILILSGMRPNELYNLTWKRVVLGANPYIHIRKDGSWAPKAHTERMIPISKDLLKTIGKPKNPDELVAGRNEYGFFFDKYLLERSFKRALKQADLAGKIITLYCCRDTYATNLALQGYEAHSIAARLGHRNINTSMRYVSLVRLNAASFRSKAGK
ncbi:MAG: site-specific integrase [Elusimicrobiota bacterium]